MKIVCLDAGHGGKDPGAVANGLKEKDIVLKMAQLIKPVLESHGVKVIMTRSDDRFIELSERANISNRNNASLFFSLHVNAGGGTGYESFVYTSASSNSIKLQKLVNEKAIQTAKTFGLGVHGNPDKKGNLAVVRLTKAPALLAEICFLDSKDSELLKKESFIENMALSYAQGILSYLGIEMKKPQPKSTTLHKVQVGAFSDKTNAIKLMEELKKKGYPAFITED